MPLFTKAACFTDIHFGKKNNSRVFNRDCEDFVTWFIEKSISEGCETCIFLGDWHDHRSLINVSTLNYTFANLRRLNDAFKKVYFIIGNHDLYYREKREIHSLPMADELNNFVVINEPVTIDNVAFLPWLVHDEWKTAKNIKAKYLFGHLEIPGFKMNAHVEMPDHGEIQKSHFTNQEYAFSGHFHKRQSKGNVFYIGNPFGHDFSDSGDDDRGMMTLEWDGKPVFHNYDTGPRYATVNLSEIIASPDDVLKPKSYIKAFIDVDVTYEEASFMRELFIENNNIRELKLVTKVENEYVISEGVQYESVNQVVIDQLNNIQSENFDNATLIKLYNEL